jgi:uncharacterized protein YcaQ
MAASRTVSLQTARRLAVTAQYLSRPQPGNDDASVLELVRRLGCLQLDPINVVARTHLLVLFSRVGAFDTDAIRRLTYERNDLFEYWAHAASLVPTSDLGIHRLEMMRQRGQVPGASRHQRYADWVRDNDKLRRHVLTTLRRNGPTRSRDIADISERAWSSTGWTNERNVSRMLDHLWSQGRIVVADRRGIERYWDLIERHLPREGLRARPSPRSVTRRAALRSLRALGIATPKHINDHFIRGRYVDLPQVIETLGRKREIVAVTIDEPGLSEMPFFVHHQDAVRLDAIENGEFGGRTTLLSPFDNLICDRVRAQKLFGFDYKIEIYTPVAKRRYGYYTMPLLVGDRLVARVDPRMDRKTATLEILAVHPEPDAPPSVHDSVSHAISDLAGFLGATEVTWPS